jgi:hypothetical protein
VEIVTTRWRVMVEIEFETRDYPTCERLTAERQARWAEHATNSAAGEINCGRLTTRVASVEPVS